ncbi:MAG: NnrS family protein [Gammaproteobacteria bacterium]|nr:NnrS family protein [Gammaproteobacteria bacterium]
MQAPADPARAGLHFPPRPGFALLAYGFRPFFLLAGLHAALAMPLWMAFLHGVDLPGAPLAPLAWHGHEMIYGFVMAAVAGFLLTAVPSWTGRRGFAGMPLLALVLVWLAGRVAVTVPLGLPASVVAAVDLAFPVALVLAILPSLVRSGNRRNLVLVGLLALLFIANLHFYLAGAASTEPLRLAVNALLLLVAMIGGRIVPAFTSARLKQRGFDVRLPGRTLIDRAALGAVVAVLVVDLVQPGGMPAGIVAALAAVLLALRLARWHGHRSFGEPILWVLHVAYAWLAVGLTLKSAWLLGGFVFASGWLHALSAGAFATMILAVMSRAALGHTGRALVAPASVAVAYALLTGAALARVFGPTAFPGAWTTWLGVAATLWTVAFVLYVIAYAPILCAPRVDGRPG